MDIIKKEIISYTFFNKKISKNKNVLGIQKINSDDKPLLIDILSDDIFLEDEYLFYKGKNYLLESLEIILYDEVPYLCETFSRMSFCKMPDCVLDYLSVLNTHYYGITTLNQKYFISKIDSQNKIIFSLPFHLNSKTKIVVKKNNYEVKKEKNSYNLKNADFFLREDQIIAAIFNSEINKYVLIGHSNKDENISI